MEKYVFSYSVDTWNADGDLEMNGMILNHDEVVACVKSAIQQGGAVDEVSVAMFNEKGDLMNERNITRMFVDDSLSQKAARFRELIRNMPDA